jgi:asparagine synthase (glutamine-hydrolysing)
MDAGVLTCRIDLADTVNGTWQWQNDRLCNHGSWIEPMRNNAIEPTATNHNGIVRLVIGERDHAGTGTMNRPGARDFVALDIAHQRVRLTASEYGTAPLYLAMADGVLDCSWHLPDLRHHLRADRLLDRAVARVLTRGYRYSSDTLFPGVRMLTERATATATPAGLTIDYPPPASHVLQARQPRPSVDLVEALEQLLDQAVHRAVPPGSAVGLELSGGLDSANLALALPAHSSNLICFGLLLDDLLDTGQTARRHAVTSQLSLPDVTVRASDHPPFEPGGIRGRGVPHDPASAYYREAFDALRDAATGQVSIMTTGLGGEELLTLRPDEQPPRAFAADLESVIWLGKRARAALDDINTNQAPPAVLPLPVLMSLALHNPAYLSAGIWPIAPLADPALVRFAEQLPTELRRRKVLLRERLRRGGLPRHVVHPSQQETFSPLMQLGLRQHGLPLLAGMLRESILIDTGYVDRGRLTAAYHHATTTAQIPSTLCDTITLELGLRSLTSADERIRA